MSWLKRAAGPGAAFLFGVGLRLSGWTVHWLGWTLMAVAVVWGVSALPAVASSVPSISWERGDGLAVRFRWPERATRRRLRAETLALVADIHAYVQNEPSGSTQTMAEHSATSRAMAAAKDEQEKNAIWEASTAAMVERHERERQGLAQHFGGRIRHVAAEYQRRGMLDAGGLSKLEWEAGSSHWIVSAAITLEALAHRLKGR